jgi:hypothetical protein
MPQHEYYEAKLFRKSPKEFFQALVFKFLIDFGELDFLLEGTDESFDELWALSTKPRK